jgi:hypothetical protein
MLRRAAKLEPGTNEAASSSGPAPSLAPGGRPKAAPESPFSVRLTRPLNAYPPADARAHAEDLAGACAVLGRGAFPTAATVLPVPHGVVLLVSRHIDALSPAECEDVLATMASLADRIRARRGSTEAEPVTRAGGGEATGSGV